MGEMLAAGAAGAGKTKGEQDHEPPPRLPCFDDMLAYPGPSKPKKKRKISPLMKGTVSDDMYVE